MSSSVLRKVRFRSALTSDDRKLLAQRLKLHIRGEFDNYFNPFRVGGARGADATHGPMQLWMMAVEDPPDVYQIEAWGDQGVPSAQVAALWEDVLRVVDVISDLVEPDDGAAVIHLFVRHLGRPAGTLYRLRCEDPVILERRQRGTWMVATESLYWVLAQRVRVVEIDHDLAGHIEKELDREWEADSHDSLYTPVLPDPPPH